MSKPNYYRSDFPGAPVLNGTGGSLIAVLDACLVQGFGQVTASSLAVASEVATLTVNAGHGFSDIYAGAAPIDTLIEISGATPSGLNGIKIIASIPSSTVLTFAAPGIGDGAATGTIVAQRPPAGWTKAYSATNKAAYVATAVGATGGYLQVDDSGPGAYTYREARIRGYGAMTSATDGTEPFPTIAQASSGRIVRKSSTLDATARSWKLLASDRFFAFSALYSPSYAYGDLVLFGDLKNPRAENDAYHCIIFGCLSESGTGNYPNNSAQAIMVLGAYNSPSSAMMYIRRNHLGNLASGPIAAALTGANHITTMFGAAGLASPLAVNAGYRYFPLTVWSDSQDRGELPFLFHLPHTSAPGGVQLVRYPNDEQGATSTWPIAATNASNTAGFIATDLSGVG
jgi:hypothetical protein